MTLIVKEIENGVVIDHIDAGKGSYILYLLNLNKNYSGTYVLLSNADSKKLNKKDVLKFTNKMLSEKELKLISLFAPKGTICIIKNKKVIEKKNAELPQKINGIFTCPNERCITNSEQIKTRFELESKNPVRLRCHYCERVFKPKEFVR